MCAHPPSATSARSTLNYVHYRFPDDVVSYGSQRVPATASPSGKMLEKQAKRYREYSENTPFYYETADDSIYRVKLRLAWLETFDCVELTWLNRAIRSGYLIIGDKAAVAASVL